MNTPKRLSEKRLTEIESTGLGCHKELMIHIRALESEIAGWKRLSLHQEGNRTCDEEISELRAEAQSWEDTAKKWRISAQSLYAENAKLRTALEHYSMTAVFDGIHHNQRFIAKEALASTSDEALSAIREAIKDLENHYHYGYKYFSEGCKCKQCDTAKNLKRLFGGGK